METIEERAKECVRHLTQGWVLEAAGDQLEALFIAGAESKHAELTRWYSPRKELPEHRKQVLVKTGTENYDVAYYSDNVDGWIANDGIYNTAQIIGWREIHE